MAVYERDAVAFGLTRVYTGGETFKVAVEREKGRQSNQGPYFYQERSYSIPMHDRQILVA